jgi:uncharacterized membrane protein HdeD (DUF308 family)
MSMNQSDVDRLRRAVAAALREHWMLFVVEGIVLLVLGAAAIIIPQIATLAVALLLGWLFFISGVVGLIATYLLRHAPGFLWSLVSAVLGIAAGVALIGWPESAALSLTLILILFFLIEGFASIMFALEHKRELSGQWEWMLASGIVDLVLGGIILIGLPGTAAWAIGLLVGVNMLFGGVALIVMGLHARRIDPRSVAPAS